MGKHNGFQRKGKLGTSAAPVTKKFTAPTSGLEDVYFTWDTVSNAARYANITNNSLQRVCRGSLS